MQYLRKQKVNVKIDEIFIEKVKGTIINIGKKKPLFVIVYHYHDTLWVYKIADFATGVSYGHDCEAFLERHAIENAIKKVEKFGEKVVRDFIAHNTRINSEYDYPDLERLKPLR